MTYLPIFTLEEKKTYLKKNGYDIMEHSEDYWEQYGNHDSCGEWKTKKYFCAVQGNEQTGIHNEINKVFENLLHIKFKEFLLR